MKNALSKFVDKVVLEAVHKDIHQIVRDEGEIWRQWEVSY